MKEKSTGKGGGLIALLIVIDLALLIWIGSAWIAREKQVEPMNTEDERIGTQESGDVIRPDDADFLEWYVKDVMWKGVPAGAEYLSDFPEITGVWKGLIYLDPENRFHAEGIELLNFTVKGKAEAAAVTADWFTIYRVEEGKGYSEEEKKDTVFSGTWEDGVLRVTGAGTILLTDFYTIDGVQYAIGTFDTPDGIPASVAMVRQ